MRFSTWWKAGFARSKLLQVCGFLCSGVTKLIQIPRPPGLLHRDNWHHHASPPFAPAEAHFFCAPQERMTFTRPSVVVPPISHCEPRPRNSISLRHSLLQDTESTRTCRGGWEPRAASIRGAGRGLRRPRARCRPHHSISLTRLFEFS